MRAVLEGNEKGATGLIALVDARQALLASASGPLGLRARSTDQNAVQDQETTRSGWAIPLLDRGRYGESGTKIGMKWSAKATKVEKAGGIDRGMVGCDDLDRPKSRLPRSQKHI